MIDPRLVTKKITLIGGDYEELVRLSRMPLEEYGIFPNTSAASTTAWRIFLPTDGDLNAFACRPEAQRGSRIWSVTPCTRSFTRSR